MFTRRPTDFLARTKRIVNGSFDAGREAVNLSQLRLALTAGNEHKVLELMSTGVTASERYLTENLEAVLTSVVNASGKAGTPVLNKQLGLKAATAGLRTAAPKGQAVMTFDATNPAASLWARKHAAKTITGIGNTTREVIRDFVEGAFEEQIEVSTLANELMGLLGDAARAEMIARTETMSASNMGQQMLWEQAVGEGFLTGDEKKVWIVTPDDVLCLICEPMEDVTVALDDTFNVDGEDIAAPPAHPNCRCTVGLVQ
jgi:hypothetical protein